MSVWTVNLGGLRNACCEFLFANPADRLLAIRNWHPQIHVDQIITLMILTGEADSVHCLLAVEGDITRIALSKVGL